MSRLWRITATLAFLILSMPAMAQPPTPEAKAEFILSIVGIDGQLNVGSDILRSSMLKAIEENNTRQHKIKPKAAERFARIFEQEFEAARPKFKAATVNYLVNQLTQQELDTLYDFYRSPLGLSASTKVHWLSMNLWPAILPQMSAAMWPPIREKLMKDPELRRTLMQ